jgi:hypothetical protein
VVEEVETAVLQHQVQVEVGEHKERMGLVVLVLLVVMV